jgi:hypothetical protein
VTALAHESTRLPGSAGAKREVPMVPTVNPAPERSIEQRMEALASANRIRSRRAELKRDLKLGKVSIHDLLISPPEYVHSAKVFDLLLAAPKYGRVKVSKVLQLCRISPTKTVGGLSPRQRAELVSMLRGNFTPHRVVLVQPGLEPPSTFQRGVLALAVLEYGAITDRNALAAATALGTNPSAVKTACADLKRKRLMDLTGRPTAAGRVHSSVLPAATAA